MRFRRHYSMTKGELNMTPLVDVVLQQLIYFMLTSSFMMQPGIRIKLPTAVTTEQVRKIQVFVSVSEKGTIFYEDRPVSLVRLEQILRQEVRRQGTAITLVVRGDEQTAHGNVVRVMDRARKAGIERIAIATMPDFNE